MKPADKRQACQLARQHILAPIAGEDDEIAVHLLGGRGVVRAVLDIDSDFASNPHIATH